MVSVVQSLRHALLPVGHEVTNSLLSLMQCLANLSLEAWPNSQMQDWTAAVCVVAAVVEELIENEHPLRGYLGNSVVAHNEHICSRLKTES